MQAKAKLALLSLFLLISSPFLLTAQTSLERYQKIRGAMDAKDTASAIRELRAFHAADPKTFSANNYDYLLARLSEQTGDRTSAQANYDAAIARNSILSGYSFWHLAQMARASGDLVLERERLRRFLALVPSTQQQEMATLRMGESFHDSQDDSGTISSLRPLLNSTNVPVAREAMALTAQAFQRSGKVSDARTLFSRLVMQMPDASRPDDYALIAVRVLDEMDSTAQIPQAEHLLRASVYHFNRDFAGARKHYLAVVQDHPNNATVPNALYQLGRGFYLENQYPEAIKYFQRVVQEFPESSSARDALSFTAGAYNRMKQTDNAVAAYKQFLQRFPDAPNPERTYINIIDALHEAGRYNEALDWVQQARNKFQGQLGATLALFAQLRINLAQGNWSGVVADAQQLQKAGDLGGTRVASGTTLSEVAFLHAFALEQIGRMPEAVDAYLSIPDGRNEYYGQKATARLQAMASDPKARTLIQSRETAELAAAKQGDPEKARTAATAAFRLSTSDATRNEALQILKTSYKSLPAYSFPALRQTSLGRQTLVGEQTNHAPTPQTLADELFFLGLYDEALPIYGAAQPTPVSNNPTNGSSDLSYTLAILSLRGGLANRAVRYAEALWKPIAADFVIELAPREFAELLYPAPFREALTKHAPARSVDPRLVLAIARQESRFMVQAKSVAAARGMMQFIPETANEMARELGRNGFQQNELYDPDTAILFGSHYLASLFKQFPGQPEAVIASYNGGPDNVARWIGRSRATVPERYVPEIGFAQTKDYVFRVMTNLRAYQQLYPQL